MARGRDSDNQENEDDEGSRADRVFGLLARKHGWVNLAAIAGVLGVCLVVLATAAFSGFPDGPGRLSGGPSAATEPPSAFSPAQADRASCADVGRSDLRSPSEGLWFQRNCVIAANPTEQASMEACNRKLLDRAEFIEISEGLFLFRQTPASPAYLWQANGPNCFDLVSGRMVTALCADQTVTFRWDIVAACSAHGGVLILVNGR